jgi:hypothetical protein
MPSRFLDDLGLELPFGGLAADVGDDFDYADDNLQPFAVGDRVRSSRFGAGQVIDVDGLAVRVQFDSGTNKLLNVQYAGLVKI